MEKTITWKCLKCLLPCETMEVKEEHMRSMVLKSLCCNSKVRLWEKK